LLRCITKNLATLFSLQNGDKKDEPELVVIPAAAKPAESGPPRRSMLEDSDEDEDESEEEVSPQEKNLIKQNKYLNSALKLKKSKTILNYLFLGM
jgi:hypothetical protein